ncbi:MAG: protein kinase [Thermoanaerobaculales bacterium]|nr:protein kinase [Thermoanaerobaculales bacterium]
METPQRIGKYEIISKIAVGGFGVIFKAWDPFIKRAVAVKMCASPDEEVRQRFHQEAQFVGNLVHRNITLVFDFGMQDDVPYLVQEFLSGYDLDHLLNSGVLGDINSVASILLQVAEGLRFAHSKGIIHRDIKPSNIRILEDGTVKIMDFGIAKAMEGGSNLTQTGIALGTAGYLAPEQIQGATVDPRTDLFSLGVVGYELITGVRPFKGASLSNVLYKILNEEPDFPRVFSPSCPPELEAVITRCMSKEPDLRFQDADSVIEALRMVPLEEIEGADARDDTTGVLRLALDKLPAQQTPSDEPSTAEMDGTKVLGDSTPAGGTEIHHEPAFGVPSGRRGHPILIMFLVLIGLLGAGGVVIYVSPEVQGVVFGPQGAPWIPTPTPTPTATPTPTPVPPTPTPSATATPEPTQGPVQVKLVVDPPSPLQVDGRWVGKRNQPVQILSLSLMPGGHDFTLHIKDMESKTLRRTVSVHDGQTLALTVDLGFLTVNPLPGQAPPGGIVFLDGERIGKIPLIRKKIPAGEHKLVIRWEGHEPFVRSIVVPSLPSPGLNVGDAAPPG